MKIKTYNKISKKGLNLFPEQYVVNDSVENEDAILVRSAALHEIEFNPQLKAIARAGAGTNNVPIERCNDAGIVVFNTPGANANAVKELVVAALIMSARPIYPAIEWIQTLNETADFSKVVEKGKSNFVGPEIAGKRLGVIGLGAIGIKVANLAVHLGMEVYGYDPYLSVDNAWSLSTRVIHAKKLEEIYKKCDFITLHVPETKDTKGMINAEALQLMKNGTRLLNFARGGLVEANDVIAAVEKGKLAAYVTDFATPAMLGRKNIYPLPHLGASTPESEENCAVMAVQQLKDYLENGNIVNSVNMPTVTMDRSGHARVVCVHRNVPNMIAQITNVLSQEGINIANLLNKSKGEMAVTLVDIEANVGDIKQKIEAIDQVLKVRIIE